MVQNIFEVISSAVTQFANTLQSGITALTSIVYTTGENGGFTFVGTLLLVAVGMAIVYWIFRLLRGLIAGVSR